MSQPVTPRPFIGRTEELARIGNLLDGLGPQVQKLGICGRGGNGKTALLRQVAVLSEERTRQGKKIRVAGPIDFYNTVNHSYFGLVKSIVSVLGVDQFPRSGAILAEIEARPSAAASQDAQDALRAAVSAFVEEFNQFSDQADRCVLTFDTLEELRPDEEIRDWLFTKLLPQLTTKSLLIFAGRDEGCRGAFASAELIELKEFNQEDVRNYLAGYLPSGDLASLSTTDIERIEVLTGRRPILLGLATDWMRDMPGEFRADILDVPQPDISDGFAPLFVQMFLEKLQELETHILLAMSLMYRRFDREVLASLFNMSEEQAQERLNRLFRLTFVKYRAPEDGFAGSCLLHDEMRDLINRHVWPTLSKMGGNPQQWLQDIISYYDGKVKTSVGSERYEYIAERLFYQLKADVDAGVAEFERVANTEVLPAHNLDLGVLVEREVQRPEIRKHLSQDHLDRIGVARAGMAFAREETTAEARAIIEGILQSHGAEGVRNPALRAEIDYELGRYDVIDSQYVSAYPRLERSLDYFLHLDPPQLASRIRSGTILNYLGWARRRQGRLDDALRFYEQAQSLFNDILKEGESPEAELRLNFVLGNLSAVYRLKGLSFRAVIFPERAIKICDKLGNEREKARNLNNRGMAFRDMARYGEAEDAFRQALEILQRSHIPDRVLIGRTYHNVGFLHYRGREWSKPVEARLKQELAHWRAGLSETDRGLLDKGLKELFEAESCLSETGLEAELVPVYNKLGGCYLLLGNANKAEHYTQRSLELAERCNDYYHIIDCCADMAALIYYLDCDGDIGEWATKAERLSAKHGLAYPYLEGRLETTLGNIAYDREEILGPGGAIDHFARACEKMRAFSQESYESHLVMLGNRLLALEPAVLEQAAHRQLAEFHAERKRMSPENDPLPEFDSLYNGA